jgi:hypothetical protein
MKHGDASKRGLKLHFELNVSEANDYRLHVSRTSESHLIGIIDGRLSNEMPILFAMIDCYLPSPHSHKYPIIPNQQQAVRIGICIWLLILKMR